MFRRRRQQLRLATQIELPPLLDFPFGQDPLRFAPQTDLPPLLDLPPHLLQQILNHLDEPYDLSLMFLRRTHPILRGLIPWGYLSNRQIKNASSGPRSANILSCCPKGSTLAIPAWRSIRTGASSLGIEMRTKKDRVVASWSGGASSALAFGNGGSCLGKGLLISNAGRGFE